jgi:alpha-L-fucosidase
VLTSKHHDGFCMFDAPGTEYKITRTPYGRDIVGELAGACAEVGMPFGLYYSPPDMHHPGYRDTSRPAVENWFGEPARPQWREYLDYMEAQIRFLLTHYGRISILWFDGLFDHDKYDPDRFHRLIRKTSPQTLVNDRLGGSGDYATPEQGVPPAVPVRPTAENPRPHVSTRQFLGLMRLLRVPLLRGLIKRAAAARERAGTPLQSMPTAVCPSPEEFQPWETCMTMNGSWGYCPADRRWKSTDALIRTIVDVASKGGNLLLNVGPRPDGTFPEEAVERLRDIGAWMRVNGEAIYDSTFGRLQGAPGLRATSKDQALYVGITSEPAGGTLALDLGSPPQEVALLGSGEAPTWEHHDGTLEVLLPAAGSSLSPRVLRIREATEPM